MPVKTVSAANRVGELPDGFGTLLFLATHLDYRAGDLSDVPDSNTLQESVDRSTTSVCLTTSVEEEDFHGVMVSVRQRRPNDPKDGTLRSCGPA